MNLPKIKLYAVRHAATPWNFEGRIQGRKDVCVAPCHLRAIQTTFDNYPELTCQIISSPLTRCLQTAEAYFQNRSVKTDKRISERDYGLLEGMLRSQLRKSGKGNYVCKTKRDWEWSPEGGESNMSILNRVLDFLLSLESDTIIVTHSGPIQCLLNYSNGKSSNFPAIDHERLYCFDVMATGDVIFSGTLDGKPLATKHNGINAVV
jgi:probable phosphoglycerate mutase